MSKKLKTAAPLIDKPLALRLWEFAASLKVIKDALDGLRGGRPHQLLALAGQLRLLLTDRSKGVTPLLLEIANELNFPLTLYHGKGARSAEEATAEGPDPLLFILTGFPISLYRESPDQIEADLQSLLRLNVMRFNGVAYTTSDLIKFFANCAGGAHSPKRWSKDLAGLMSSLQLLGAPAPTAALIQLAEAVLKIGAELLREVGMVEVHLAVALPSQSLEGQATLLHMAYRTAPSSLTISLDQLGRIGIRINSMHGTQAQLLSKRALDLPSAVHIGFVQTITEDLETEMALMVNGSEVAHVRTPELVMLPADKSGYRLLVNRAPDVENSGCHVGLLEIYVWKALLAEKERAQAVVQIYKDLETKGARVVALTPSQFGISQGAGSKLQFSGDARATTLNRFLSQNRKA